MSSVSTNTYFHPLHFHREQRLLDGWVFAALTSQLSSPGTSFAVDLFTRTILLIRGQDGVVRAFENSCVHRGTQLQEIKKGRNAWKGRPVSQIQCSYHGWKYNLTGKVVGLTRPEGIKCKQHQLPEFPVYEHSGFIWVSLGDVSVNPEEFFTPITSSISHYQLEEMEPIEARDFEFDVNWKIALENALDYYHVSSVHPQTVGAHVDTEPTFDDLGWHSLQTLFIAPYGWRSAFDRHCARYRPYSVNELSSLHKYFVFPNLVVNVLPYHLTIMQFFPVGPTKSVMRYRFCQRRKPGMIERARVYASWLASRVILYEDVQMYGKIQKGMQESTLEEQPLHQLERGVEHFHGRIQRWFTEVDQCSDTDFGTGVSLSNRLAKEG